MLRSGSAEASQSCVKEPRQSLHYLVCVLVTDLPNRKESTSTGPTKFEVQIVAQFDNHNSQVWRVSWNITSTLLASSGDDGCVRLWKGAFLITMCKILSSQCPDCILEAGGRVAADAVWVTLLLLFLHSQLHGQLEVHGNPEGRREPSHWLIGSAHSHEHHRGLLSSYLSERPERDVCRKVGGVVHPRGTHPPPKPEPVRTDNLTTPHTDSDRCCSLTNYLDPTVSKRCKELGSQHPAAPELAVWCAVSVFTKPWVIALVCTGACCSAVSGPTLHCQWERNHFGIKSNDNKLVCINLICDCYFKCCSYSALKTKELLMMLKWAAASRGCCFLGFINFISGN